MADPAYALNFDGVNDYVAISDSTSLRITSEISIFAWIKTAQIKNEVDVPIIEKMNYVYGLYFDKYTVGSGTGACATLSFNMRDTAFNWQSTGSSRKFYNKVWNFVGVTYDQTNVTFYANDATQSLAFAHGGFSQAPFNLRVAANVAAPILYVDGVIDEVRIYNRVLTAEEILKLYQETEISRDGLVLDMDFNEQTADDYSGYGNNGTVNGATFVLGGKYCITPPTGGGGVTERYIVRPFQRRKRRRKIPKFFREHDKALRLTTEYLKYKRGNN